MRHAPQSALSCPPKSLELQHTIQQFVNWPKSKILKLPFKPSWTKCSLPLLRIPGMGVRMGAVILAEIGDFSRFDSPDKILAYAGMSPSTYQSGSFHCLEPTRTWKNEVPVTCATLFTMPQNTSVIGTRPLPLTLPRNGPREALQRCALSCGKEIGTSDFLQWRNLSGHTAPQHLTPIFISSSRRPEGRQLCYTPFEPSKFLPLLRISGLTFNS